MTTLANVVAGAGADTVINQNYEAVSPAGLYGRRMPGTSGLTWAFYGGIAWGNAIANGTVTLTASATNYIVANRTTGAVSVATTTTNWNNATGFCRLYAVVVGASTVTSWVDHRECIGGGASGSAFSPVATEAGAAHNIAAAEAGSYIRFTSPSAKAVTFRTNATEALPANAEWHMRNAGAGLLTIAAASGVTINAPAGGTLALSEGMTVTAKRVAADVFDLIGQTVPA